MGMLPSGECLLRLYDGDRVDLPAFDLGPHLFLHDVDGRYLTVRVPNHKRWTSQITPWTSEPARLYIFRLVGRSGITGGDFKHGLYREYVVEPVGDAPVRSLQPVEEKRRLLVEAVGRIEDGASGGGT